ncbi:type II toxin-antitoxin system HipA family toxin [Marinospirillum sp.]|uniref:type II toxin-antitoxin system HipA family toxin n=1 Tax=Marinospirillum sp. TaxID=2183934 RepID=UPI00384D7F99
MTSSASQVLDVRVAGRPAGQLFREDGQRIFIYQSEDPADFVSLTMPVRKRDYVHPCLHPVFEMHLPEGYLLAVIKRHFSKLVTTDDLGILELLAPGIRGRLHYGESEKASAPLSLSDLLQPSHAGLFEELVERFALQSALSGVQPKVLARVEDKAALSLDDYIVKAWGEDYPQLALNEYWCMRVVQAAGIPVPDFYRSDDDRLFIMKRFDLKASGEALGFEDFCVLQGRKRDDKYEGSYEQLVKTLKTFVSPAYKRESLQQLFKLLVLNNRLQNGDAHLKNFAVVYEDIQHIRLAPAYDVVSTTVYIPSDVSALTLMGSRKWWGKKHLLRFGVQVCDLTRHQAENLYAECEVALAKVSEEVAIQLEKETHPDKIRILNHLLFLMVESHK